MPKIDFTFEEGLRPDHYFLTIQLEKDNSIIVYAYQNDITEMTFDTSHAALHFGIDYFDALKTIAVRYKGNWVSLYDIWQEADRQIDGLIQELEEDEANESTVESGEDYFRRR